MYTFTCRDRFLIPKHRPDYTHAVAFIDRWELWSIMLYEHKRALEGYWGKSFKQTGIKLTHCYFYFFFKYDSSLLHQNITKCFIPVVCGVVLFQYHLYTITVLVISLCAFVFCPIFLVSFIFISVNCTTYFSQLPKQRF